MQVLVDRSCDRPAAGVRRPAVPQLVGQLRDPRPIDNYRAPSGGNLRRGYVSHGCIRMEAAGVLEVYARIRGVGSVPVHVQRAPEREGERVDCWPPVGQRASTPALAPRCKLKD